MGIERLVVPIEWKASDNDQTLEGYASTFGNVDLGGDVVMKGAFTKTIQNIKANGIPLLADHVPMTSSVLGTIFDAKETSKGLWIKARFSSAPSAQDVRIKMLEGHVNKLSIGYEPTNWKFADKDGQRVRELHEVKLWETSGVVFPMNPEAAISRVKSVVDALAPEDRQHLLDEITDSEPPEAKATANEIRDVLAKTLREHYAEAGSWAYLRDFDSSKAWYEVNGQESGIFQRGYTVNEKESVIQSVDLKDDRLEVRAVVKYEPINVEDNEKSTTLVLGGDASKSSAADEADGPGDESGEKAADPVAAEADEAEVTPDEGVKGWDRWRSEAALNGHDPDENAHPAKRAGLEEALRQAEQSLTRVGIDPDYRADLAERLRLAESQ